MTRKTFVGISLLTLVGGYACTTKEKNLTTTDTTVLRNIAGQETSVDPLITWQIPNTPKIENAGATFASELQALTERKDDSKIKGKIDEIKKSRLALFGKWVRAYPIATFEHLRKNYPIWEIESFPMKKKDYEFGSTVVVTRFNNVKQILDNPTIFTVRNYNKRMVESVGHFMLAYDSNEESRHAIRSEKPWMRAMMPREDWPRIRQLVNQLTQESIAKHTYLQPQVESTSLVGRLEIVNDVARRVPIRLTGEYFGFPGPSEEKMYEWSRATQDDFFHNIKNEEDIREKGRLAGQEMKTYVRTLIQEQESLMQSNPPAKENMTVLQRMIASKTVPVNDFAPDDERINSNIIGTLVGGVETTQAAITQTLSQILRRPQILQLARKAARENNNELLDAIVWEALRFDPVNPFVLRFAEQDFTLTTGEVIKKGSHVLVATHAAMFDPEVYSNPLQFKIDRTILGRKASDWKGYFHLGYGDHRCLGDYVAAIEVPEVIKVLLNQDGLKLASGFNGKIDRKGSAFPDNLVVEYDVQQKYSPTRIQIGNSGFPYEEYLQNFDRSEYRNCLSGNDKLSSLPYNLRRHFWDTTAQKAHIILYCRLNKEFRNCLEDRLNNKLTMTEQSDKTITPFLNAVNTCDSGKASLTVTEKEFYTKILTRRPVDYSKITTDQAQPPGNDTPYAYEKYLMHYDHYRMKESATNPLAIKSFPSPEYDSDMLFYIRLNLPFRNCMGLPVVLNKVSSKLGNNRADQYEICKDGRYNPETGIFENGLSREEKYFYERLMLDRDVRFNDISDSKKY